MATNKKCIEIPNRFKSINGSEDPEISHIVAGADDIYDDAKQMKQSQHNAQTDTAIDTIDADLNTPSAGIKSRLATLENEVSFDGDFQTENTPQGITSDSGKIATANAVRGAIDVKTGYFECDTAAATAEKRVNAPGFVLTNGGAIKIKMVNRNSAADATLNINSTGVMPLFYNGQRANASNTWDANEVVEVYYDGTNYQANNVAGSAGDGVFDISAYNLDGNSQPTQYASLADALGTNGANVPQSKRKGGMSVKFVCSSDNKYVQYRFMLSTFTTAQFANANNWQGVDDEPTARSNNLVKSGGVITGIEQSMSRIADEIIGKNLFDKTQVIEDKIVNTQGALGTQAGWTYNKCTGLIPVEPNKYYCISGSTTGANGPNIRCIASDGTTAMKVLAPASGTEYATNYNMPNANGTDTLNMLNGQFKTPANAAYVQFNVAAKNTDSTDTIMLEIVGSSYNPDFVPSSYVPYVAPTLVIKNEVLDMDEEPVSESDKPVKSSGIYSAIAAVNNSLTEFEGHKVTEFGETPSDSNFPSEKLVYDKAVAPLGEVVEMKQSKNLFDKSGIIGDKLVNTSGGLGNIGSYTYNKCTGLIPVKPNKYYCISGDTITAAPSIRCLAADGTTVMKVLAPSTGTAYATNYNMPNSDGTASLNAMNGQFKTPANAAYVQFNVATKNTDSINTTMIELVGDTYNPDFVPSSYEPYVAPKTMIRNEAIEIDDEPVEDSDKPITSGGVYEALQELTPDATKKLSVLLIGSSHGVNTISMFPVLAYHAGIDITVGNLYTGSATLGLYSDRPARQIPYMADHDVAFGRFAVYENGAWSTKSTTTISYALSEYQWDVIILQRGATEDWWNENVSQFYQHLLDYIKEHCDGYTPKIYFNSGIADATKAVDKTTQIGDTNTLISTAKQQKAEYGIGIIPTAVAVQYARMTCLKNTGYGWVSGGTTCHDMSSDTQHLDTGIGQYVTGCTVFEKIVGDFFNMSVRELAYYPVYADVSGNVVNEGSQYFTAITDYYSRIAKQCAMLAVMDGEYVADHAAALTAKYASLPSTYTITNTLTGCTNSNTATSVGSDEVYMTTLTPNSGLTIQSVTVEMGGTDITSSVYAAYEGYYAIRIGVVTGNIVITASAS